MAFLLRKFFRIRGRLSQTLSPCPSCTDKGWGAFCEVRAVLGKRVIGTRTRAPKILLNSHLAVDDLVDLDISEVDDEVAFP